jgi:hypothetical protein
MNDMNLLSIVSSIIGYDNLRIRLSLAINTRDYLSSIGILIDKEEK